MHLLGWVSIHDTHHHMGVLRKFLQLVFLVCGFLGCYSSTMTNTMKSDFSDAVWDVMQTSHQSGTPGIDESCRMVRSQTKAFQLSR